jgi:hypothetical protein
MALIFDESGDMMTSFWLKYREGLLQALLKYHKVMIPSFLEFGGSVGRNHYYELAKKRDCIEGLKGGICMERQKTDSITHLVKIVAAEVFEEKERNKAALKKTANISSTERIEELEAAVASLIRKVDDIETFLLSDPEPTYSPNIKSEDKPILRNCQGRIWSNLEDRMLDNAFASFISLRAGRHGRTEKAIKERIRKHL